MPTITDLMTAPMFCEPAAREPYPGNPQISLSGWLDVPGEAPIPLASIEIQQDEAGGYEITVSSLDQRLVRFTSEKS